MDVTSLLAQLQKALTKPETCEKECQTKETFPDPEKSMWDLSIDTVQLTLEELRDNKNRNHTVGKPKGSKNKRTSLHDVEPATTPMPLTLQQPPSEPSVKTFETSDAVLQHDNISDCFDENDNADEEDPEEKEEVIYGAYCPKCTKKAHGYTEVLEKFGFKLRNGKKCVQSWCTKCRNGMEESPPSNRTFLPTACSEENRVFDEDTNIINRRGGIFCVSHVSKSENGPTNNGMKFHDTIRKASESWKEAEERHRARSHPIVQKRGKLMSILSKQEKLSMQEIMKKYEGRTTMELFCKIKQESPALLKPLGKQTPE